MPSKPSSSKTVLFWNTLQDVFYLHFYLCLTQRTQRIIISINQSMHYNSRMTASVLRKICCFLSASAAASCPCLGLFVSGSWCCWSAQCHRERRERHALTLYCAVTEKNKINVCLCTDKEVSIACTQSFNLTAVMYLAYWVLPFLWPECSSEIQ